MRGQKDAHDDARTVLAEATGASLRTVERKRLRELMLRESPMARVRRLVVLISRFNAMANAPADPKRLIEPLRGILAQAHEAFEAASDMLKVGQGLTATSSEQGECLWRLEMLSRGLLLGSPDAWRGLGHAMDTLLVHCVLLDAACADQGKRLAPAAARVPPSGP